MFTLLAVIVRFLLLTTKLAGALVIGSLVDETVKLVVPAGVISDVKIVRLYGELVVARLIVTGNEVVTPEGAVQFMLKVEYPPPPPDFTKDIGNDTLPATP